MRGLMSCHPTQLWERLSPSLQSHICADLTALFQEVIDAQLRSDYTPTSQPKGRHLGYPFNAGQLEDGHRDLKCRKARPWRLRIQKPEAVMLQSVPP